MKKNPAQGNATTTASFSAKLIAPAVKPLRGQLSAEGEDAAIRWLAQSIQTHTQLVPIVADGDRIVDGVRRLRACEIAGVKPWIVQLKDVTKGGTIDAWNALNFEGRRHLSLNERAFLGAELSKGQKPGSNQHTKTSLPEGGMTQGEAAKVVLVSPDLIQKAKKVVQLAHEHDCQDEVLNYVREGRSIPQIIRTLETKSIKKKVDKIAENNGPAASSLDAMISQGLKLSFVLADPPWDYGQPQSTATGAPHHIYPTMPLEDIKAMPVARIAAKDSVLWLWVPNCLIPQGLEVMREWGFEYVTTAAWEKNTAPPTNGAVKPYHETLLIGKRGAGLKHEGAPMKSVTHAPLTAHSQKPVVFSQEVERLYPGAAKIELFCRQPRKGWIAWGNQAGGTSIAPAPRSQPAKNATRRKPVVKRAVSEVKKAARKR